MEYSTGLINYLSEHADLTFAANLDTGAVRILKTPGSSNCHMWPELNFSGGYADLVRTIVSNCVLKADRTKLEEWLDSEFIKRKLAESVSFKDNFRKVGPDGRPIWYTMTIATLTQEEVLVNFVNRNELILRRRASEALFNEYISIYYVNLEDNLITEVKHSPVFDFSGGGEAGSIEENVAGLLHLADEDYRAQMLEFVSIEHLKRVLKEDNRTEFIYSSHITGQQRWVKCSISVAERRNGVPVNLLMAFSSVEKEQVERIKLNNEIAQLHVISDSFTDSFITTYYVSLEDSSYEIYKANEYCRNNFLWEKDFFKAFRMYIDHDVHPDDRDRVREMASPAYFKEHLEQYGSFSFMLRDTSFSKEKNYRIQIIQGADDKHAAVGFMDISDEIEAEQSRMRAIEEANKANQASKMKSIFVQNISHDIRTPLNAIVGYSQLLGMPDGYLTEEEKTEFAEYINDSADMLTTLIDDVLSIADIEHGMLKVQITDAYPNNICMKSINCSKMRTEMGVKLYYTSETDGLYKIKSDPKRIQQILVNFLSNACKHTSKGEIHLHFSLSENPGWATFSVTDTGTGVSPEIAELIFKRFSSVDNDSGNSTSHGMGLDISRDLATRLGGKVGLDMSYTSGARFYLMIPAETEQ